MVHTRSIRATAGTPALVAVLVTVLGACAGGGSETAEPVPDAAQSTQTDLIELSLRLKELDERVSVLEGKPVGEEGAADEHAAGDEHAATDEHATTDEHAATDEHAGHDDARRRRRSRATLRRRLRPTATHPTGATRTRPLGRARRRVRDLRGPAWSSRRST